MQFGILTLFPPFNLTTSSLHHLELFVNDFFKIFYLFIFRQGNGGREGEKHQYVIASRAPSPGPGPQPRHVP